MNTKNTIHEQISAFADGEADASQVEAALAALRTPEGKTAWDDYHRIGDALRSDDMVFSMSDDFTTKLMKRLDDEPTIVAVPRRQLTTQPAPAPAVRAPVSKRFMLSGMAAAIMAALTIIVAQQWFGTGKGAVDADASIVASTMPASTKTSMAMIAASSSSGAAQEHNLVRDPGIDEYLLAHQRFSPSLYSTAQYARSATFAVDSDK